LLAKLLQELSRAHSPIPGEATLIGQDGPARVHQPRSLLAGSGVLYQFEEHNSPKTQRLLAREGGERRTASAPVLFVRDRQLLTDPSNARNPTSERRCTSVAGRWRGDDRRRRPARLDARVRRSAIGAVAGPSHGPHFTPLWARGDAISNL
jgi:hypothetical protein